MSIVRAIFPALLAFSLIFALVTHPSETFVVIGAVVLTLTTASSIIFFSFVAVAAMVGLERTSGRHLAPAAPVHVHRSPRGDAAS